MQIHVNVNHAGKLIWLTGGFSIILKLKLLVLMRQLSAVNLSLIAEQGKYQEYMYMLYTGILQRVFWRTK